MNENTEKHLSQDRHPDFLKSCEILSGLKTNYMGRELHVFETVESTNTIASDLAKAGGVEGTMVISEEQTKGRGRFKRKWFSPPGLGLWFSLILRPVIELKEIYLLNFASSLAVAGAIQKITGIEVALKWPNDVMFKQRKLCGILAEMGYTNEKKSERYVVLGLGINVNHSNPDFPEEISKTATSLTIITHGKKFSRVKILQEILLIFEEYYESIKTGRGKEIREKWIKFSGLIGKQVEFDTGSETIRGVVKDIADDGALVLITQHGTSMKMITGDMHVTE